MNAIFKRVSIRKYQNRPVEDEKIELILRAAMAAPSAVNAQPWEFYVVKDKEKIAQLAASGRNAGCAAGAPVVIVPCCRTAGDRHRFDDVNMANCTENILLEAAELGLGAVWLAVAPNDEKSAEVNAILGIGGDLKSFAMVPVGYPAEEREQEDRFDPARIHTLG